MGRALLTVLELVGITIVVVVAFKEVIMPLMKGKPLFPMLRGKEEEGDQSK